MYLKQKITFFVENLKHCRGGCISTKRKIIFFIHCWSTFICLKINNIICNRTLFVKMDANINFQPEENPQQFLRYAAV